MSERIADHFVSYLFDQYQGSRHVRRVASWIGFLLKAIERSGAVPQLNRERQVVFDYHGQWYKVRYKHKIGRRGGVEIIESLPGRGSPDGDVVKEIKSLDDAEDLYRSGLRKALASRSVSRTRRMTRE